MVQNDKDARALLREIQSDPLLSVAEDSAMPHEEVYPVTWDQQIKGITRTKSSLKNALLLIEYDPDSSKTSDGQRAKENAQEYWICLHTNSSEK